VPKITNLSDTDLGPVLHFECVRGPVPTDSRAFTRTAAHQDKFPIMSAGRIKGDFDHIAVIFYQSGKLFLLQCPRTELDVPEFLVCIAELHRCSAELAMACNARILAAPVTHEVASHGRYLVMVAACGSHGMLYLPLLNMVRP